MNVALFAHRLATRTPTGIDRYARELLLALSAAGGHTLFAASTNEHGDPDWLPPGVDLRRVPGWRRAVHLGWCVARRPRIDDVVRGADVVHVTAPTFPVPVHVPLVYTVHDLMPLLHPDWFGRVHRWGFREAMKDVRDNAAVVVADSASTATSLTDVVGVEAGRTVVVPLGVPPAFLAPVADDDIGRVTSSLGVAKQDYVVYVGHVNERKNVRVVIEALARIGDTRPALVIAGPEDRSSAHVRELVERRELTDTVRFAGFVPDEDLPPLVAGARALVHPSLHEGFGLTPLEAMALGVPAVVSETAALPDAVGDAALVAGPAEPDAWAAALDSLRDDDFAASRGALGQEHARRFTWARTATETSAAYARAAGDPDSRA